MVVGQRRRLMRPLAPPGQWAIIDDDGQAGEEYIEDDEEDDN